jgi:hypothetical protein
MYHTFKVLAAIERLLLLEEESVADKWKAANSLAVVRIWPWDTADAMLVSLFLLYRKSSIIYPSLLV